VALTINTNMLSLTAQRHLTGSDGAFATTVQRLSSGLRVNSARDDAAGLAISERFTSQIRGQQQAMRNANDAVSLLQTAEGAIAGVSGALQRIRELAIQSANATNSASDRQALQLEVNALLAEIDRVGATTEFNTLKIFDQNRNPMTGGGSTGDAAKDAVIEALRSGWLENAEKLVKERYGIDGRGKELTIRLLDTIDGAGGTGARVVLSGGKLSLEIDMNDFTNFTDDQAATSLDLLIAHELVHGFMFAGESWNVPQWFHEGAATLIQGWEAALGAEQAAALTASDNLGALDWSSSNSTNYSSAYLAVRYMHSAIKGAGGTGVQDVIQYLHSTAGQDLDSALANASNGAFADVADFQTKFNGAKTSFIGSINFTDNDIGQIGGSGVDGGPEIDARAGVPDGGSKYGADVMDSFVEIWEDFTESAGGGTGNILRFHVGANANQTIDTAIGGMNLGALNLKDVDISTVMGANKAILRMDSALQYASNLRASLGAQMSRMEKTIDNLQVSAENLTASRSRIIDADYAQETAALARAQVLQQAGMAMVAQANQLPLGVLSLLR
jgi:flagellin